MWNYPFPPVTIPFLHSNFHSAGKPGPITYIQRTESTFFAQVENSLRFFTLTAYFSAKYTRNRTTMLVEIRFSIYMYSTVHANRMHKFLVWHENSDQQRTQRAERTPENALLARVETSVVYLALTACFSDECASDRNTTLAEISTTLHLHSRNY